jgi:thiosulfate dehydrogenase [quinone] large subunit
MADTAGAVEGWLSAWLLAVLRVVMGITWLHEAEWKVPPDFGQASGGGLWFWSHRAIEHPVFPPFNALLEAVVFPHFTLFGWLVLITEAAIGAFLIVGLATRFWAIVGFLQTFPIAFSVLNAPNEWSYAYYMMFAIHLALFATAAGRYIGLDGVLRPAWRRAHSAPARLLLRLS